MRRSNITATFQADIQTVWNIVTDNENYTWKSRNPIMEFLSYLFMNIKKMQETYVSDLRKELAGFEESPSMATLKLGATNFT